MRKCSIEDIQDGDILASAVMTPDFKVLLAEGTVLRKEYVEKLRYLGITRIAVRESEVSSDEEGGGHTPQERKKFQESVKEQVKDVLEHHVYKNNADLQRLCQTADEIINNVLEEEKIVEEIMAMQERSADLYEHSLNTCIMSTIMALHLDMCQQSVRSISIGCLLHDIGLRYIDSFYVDRSMKEMSENEILEYKKHSVNGYFSIKEEHWLDEISKNIILYHHERLDGRGYPFHRKGKEIDAEVMVVGVCDAYDELLSGIGCKKVKPYKAVEYLKAFKKEKFDARIIDEFLKITTPYPIGCKVSTNRGETAFVIRQNKSFAERPVIRIKFDAEGNEVHGDNVVDLLKEKTVFITDVLS